MILQNRRRLDLLTAERMGLRLFLEEACYFSTNKSGSSKKSDKQGLEICWHLSNSWENWLNSWNWMPWVLPFLGPLLLLTFILNFGLCLILLFSKSQDRLQAFTNLTIHKLLLTHSDYQKLWPHINPLWLAFQPFLILPLSCRKQL